MPEFFLNLIGSAGDNLVLLSLVIILCAFIFEDLTTVIIGLLVADGMMPAPLALLSLYIGVASGDAVLYAVGSLARAYPRLARYVDHDFTTAFRSWLERRYTLIIFAGHFVPGLRFTTYFASGFFRHPLRLYIPPAIIGGLLFGTVLFFTAYWFGSVTSEWVGSLRWGIALAFLFALFLIGRYNFLPYSTKRDGSPTISL